MMLEAPDTEVPPEASVEAEDVAARNMSRTASCERQRNGISSSTKRYALLQQGLLGSGLAYSVENADKSTTPAQIHSSPGTRLPNGQALPARTSRITTLFPAQEYGIVQHDIPIQRRHATHLASRQRAGGPYT